eukprot:9480631-Pyramimonas_sp.AAC.2
MARHCVEGIKAEQSTTQGAPSITLGHASLRAGAAIPELHVLQHCRRHLGAKHPGLPDHPRPRVRDEHPGARQVGILAPPTLEERPHVAGVRAVWQAPWKGRVHHASALVDAELSPDELLGRIPVHQSQRRRRCGRRKSVGVGISFSIWRKRLIGRLPILD